MTEATTVTCPACHGTSPARMRFCGHCAAPLPVVCPSCGQTNPPGMRFCGYCAAPLGDPSRGHSADAPAPSQMPDRLPGVPQPPGGSVDAAPGVPAAGAAEGHQRAAAQHVEERRLVTALFCDLVGFTPLSESLDPEEVRDLQADYFGAMAEQIERYGGTVEKYAGDAVLALFGAPVAHEDDAERAVLCALGMQGAIEAVATSARARWQAEPQIRVGVNTGDVVSGSWDTSGRQDVAVTGDALNTAARIQSVAEAGEVLVGAETMRLTRRRIRYGGRRDVTVKGKAGVVPVWPAIGIREEFGERWEGYETPLIGRDREMVLLLDNWVRAQAGEGQLVTVIGEPGVGKSRLVAEFLGTIAASAAVRVIRARSLSYGQEISLWLVADLLRSLFGIKEQDATADVAVKLRAAIPGLLQDETARAEAVDVLGEVLGLPIGESVVARAGPQIRRQALIRSLRAVLGAVSKRAATVVVLEDLHWIDNASYEVLTDVLADVLGSRVLVLAAQRPGWTAPWSDWGWPERITVRALGDHEAAELAEAVLGGVHLAPDLKRHIAERAGGNPFFVEEMLRALQETGGIEERDGQIHLVPGAAGRLPSTLTEVLLARLDRLDGETRQVAQVASVIGRTFPVRLLAAVVGQETALLEGPLSQLQRAEIAFPQRNPDLEYVFKHVSMRDVAYNTLVQRRRQDLHVRTARAIAALYPLDEYAEMIAYHYSRTDASEAAEWLERAGDRAAAVYANEEALGHYQEALARFARQGIEGGTRARLEEKIGTVLFTGGRYDEALEHLGQAAEIARGERNLEMAGRVTALMGLTHRYRGTPEEGITLVTPMIDLLGWAGPSEPLASLHIALATVTFLVGRYHDALASAERAAEIAQALGSERLLGDAMERQGGALLMLGFPERSRQTIEMAIPLVEAGGNLVTLSRVLTNLGEAAKITGDMAAARRFTERAIVLAEQIGNPDQLAFNLANLADILLILGEWTAAADVVERALTVVGPMQIATRAAPLMAAGLQALCSGDWETAESLLHQALAATRETGDRQLQEYVATYLADLDVARGDAEASIERLQPLVEVDDANLSVLLPTFARSLLLVGRVDEAARVATRAVEITRGQAPLFLVEALRVQGMVLQRQGRDDAAEPALQEGLALARDLSYPYGEARILEQLGHVGEALAIFRSLGARQDAARIEAASEPRQTA